ncbi:MAG TPA: TIGR00303 family protein [Nitrososphaeraceae archaeon]|nr:TIGR00303 family protein [Nitrososphaeraceae archaeon]
MHEEEYCDIIRLNQSSSLLNKFSTTNPIFICVISHTETSEIPGITIAGENTDLVKYTSAADSEFLYYGHCKCINNIPVTPDGKPTPAIITRTALQLTDIPFLIVDAGSKIKPFIPYVSFGLEPGKNIKFGKAVDINHVRKAFDYGVILGKQLAKSNDLVVIGESIPGGTTTALGVLIALGVDATFKLSSSLPINPHSLKNRIVTEGMKKAEIYFGELKDDPFKAISLFGDPMIPSVAGLADGVISSGGRVMLAGGTQMSTIVVILKLFQQSLDNICIGTTSYIAGDQSSNLVDLVKSISKNVPIFAVDLHMIESSKSGLQAFAKGFVKEGVGAGGISITSILKSKGRINGTFLLRAIEREYEVAIEK